MLWQAAQRRGYSISMWFCCMKKMRLIKEKKKDELQRPHTFWNPKTRSIGDFVAVHKIVAVQCLIWPLISQAVR